jgi:DNA-binding transcriptional regulator YdaS (Cro superfamily)
MAPAAAAPPETPSPGDLRALVARRRVRLFEVAALLGVHPSRIGKYLNEREPVPPLLAQRIQEAIERLAERR